ncbi:MAG: START domain-containing protein [Bacteroidetes bacterium]|jgi:hypothetical protein|nr:START domain-containing protein [Bacteroidota bacterium]MDF1863504.1 START domain-containing protein [Saprospiraceae bacterium]
MIKTTVKYWLIFLFCSAFTPLFSQQNWELSKEKEAIKIYTSESDKGLDFIKGYLIINTSIPRLLEVLTNHTDFVNWSYNCLESKRLEKISDLEYYVYSLTDVPWPVSDRDNVTRQKISYLKDGVVKVDLEDFPEKYPKQNDIVRIPYLKGYWLFEPISDHQTAVEYYLHASPGGNIPEWLANAGVTDAPFQTLKGLRAVAENQK